MPGIGRLASSTKAFRIRPSRKRIPPSATTPFSSVTAQGMTRLENGSPWAAGLRLRVLADKALLAHATAGRAPHEAGGRIAKRQPDARAGPGDDDKRPRHVRPLIGHRGSHEIQSV